MGAGGGEYCHCQDSHLGGFLCCTNHGLEKALNQGAATQEGKWSHTKAALLTSSLSEAGMLSQRLLILNAKREMGQICEQGGSGERQGSDLIWTLMLSPAQLLAGASKAPASPTFKPRIGHTHKVGMHYSSGITGSVQLLQSACTVPPSPKAHC